MLIPRSPVELEKQTAITVDSNIPIRLYFRSADLLLKQARVYKLEQDFEHAYILYMKYTNLGLTELPKHPSYKLAENKKNVKMLNKNCLEALEALEEMKPTLYQIYERYAKKVQEAQKIEQENSIAIQTNQWQSQQQQQPLLPPPQPEKEQRPQRSLETSDVSAEWNLQDALKGVVGVGYSEGTKLISIDHQPRTDYPSLSLYNQSDGFAYQAQQQQQQFLIQQPPQLPPKSLVGLPPLPPKIPIIHKGPQLPPKIELEQKQVLGMGPTTDASTGRGEPLRTMVLPKRLHTKFLSIAEPNTKNKIETCGILTGTLKNNVLKVTTLIIPKQTGTPDTCTTENEEELFDIQDKYDLLTFGWIHTHPTQSCFLSSVDLHTHCSYQLMLPEAIAIVCAPSQRPNFGIFRLTDPPGLDIISNCKETPIFHPHPDLPIYTGAEEGGGHVQISDCDFKVLDLRDNK